METVYCEELLWKADGFSIGKKFELDEVLQLERKSEARPTTIDEIAVVLQEQKTLQSRYMITASQFSRTLDKIQGLCIGFWSAEGV